MSFIVQPQVVTSPLPSFSANGAISAAGAPVALDAAGTVSQISSTTVTYSAGTAITPGNRDANQLFAIYDPVQNKTILMSSFNGITIYVATVSGLTISVGSEYIILSGSYSPLSIAYNSTGNSFLITYFDSGAATLSMVVVTFSGGVPTAGTPLAFTQGTTYYSNVVSAYNASKNHFVVAAANATPDRTFLWVITTSGLTPTIQTSLGSDWIVDVVSRAMVYSKQSKNIVFAMQSVIGVRQTYISEINSSNTQITLSGTSVLSNEQNIANSEVALAECGNDRQGYTIQCVNVNTGGTNPESDGVTTLQRISSGYVTSGRLDFGTLQNSSSFVVAPGPANNFVILESSTGLNFHSLRGNTGNIIKTIPTNTSPTPILQSSNTIVASSSTVYLGLSYDPVQKVNVIFYRDNATSRHTARAVRPDYFDTNAGEFIGFASTNATAGSTVNVSISGQVDANQTGLTTGQVYYLTETGALSTDYSGYPMAGKAVGTTKIVTGGVL